MREVVFKNNTNRGWKICVYNYMNTIKHEDLSSNPSPSCIIFCNRYSDGELKFAEDTLALFPSASHPFCCDIVVLCRLCVVPTRLSPRPSPCFWFSFIGFSVYHSSTSTFFFLDYLHMSVPQRFQILLSCSSLQSLGAPTHNNICKVKDTGIIIYLESFFVYQCALSMCSEPSNHKLLQRCPLT